MQQEIYIIKTAHTNTPWYMYAYAKRTGIVSQGTGTVSQRTGTVSQVNIESVTPENRDRIPKVCAVKHAMHHVSQFITHTKNPNYLQCNHSLQNSQPPRTVTQFLQTPHIIFILPNIYHNFKIFKSTQNNQNNYNQNTIGSNFVKPYIFSNSILYENKFLSE